MSCTGFRRRVLGGCSLRAARGRRRIVLGNICADLAESRELLGIRVPQLAWSVEPSNPDGEVLATSIHAAYNAENNRGRLARDGQEGELQRLL